MPVAQNITAYYKCSDQEALIHLTMKQYACMLKEKTTKFIREQLINNLVMHLHTYKQQCQSQNANQVESILVPDTLKHLPLYTLALLKQPCFKLLNYVKLDDKVASCARLMNMPMSLLPYMLYPRVYRISELEQDESFGRFNENSQ